MNLNDSTEGRWLSPDLLGGDIANPQSLNRYAYALNNPTTNIDPSGLDSMCLVDGKWTSCQPGGNPTNGSASFNPCAPTSSMSNTVCTTTLQFGMSLNSNWDEFGVLQSTSGAWRPVYAPGSTPDDLTQIGWAPTSLVDSGLNLLSTGLLNQQSPTRRLPQSPAIGPYRTPLPQQPQKVSPGCMTAALIQNFIGDDAHAGVTFATNIGAAIALRLVKQTAPGDLLPGPGWVYVGVAVLWDVGTVAKSYAECRNGELSAQ